MKQIRTLITSGCLAKQNSPKLTLGRINKVYHEYLNDKLQQEYDIELEIKIMRYERFSTTMDSVINICKDFKPDLIIFQLRYFQFLRLVELAAKYIDDDNKPKRDINFPYFKKYINEIYDPSKNYFIHPVGINEIIESHNRTVYNILSKLYHLFRGNDIRRELEGLNTLFGFVLGYYFFAISKYKNLVNDVIEFSANNKIELIFLGPMAKPKPLIDSIITNMLNNSLQKFISERKQIYIDLISKYSDTNEYLFLNDHLHLNEKAHQIISDKIIPIILSKFD